ncbi:MAG: twin-arginine translocase TatA/TatE family subunit [Sphingomonadaceae bacterium]|uniref:twin-arginine translocase TatA/TatE family subunit n=1 Tax=Thermaurantiacus sp. TaxID=2820283 RepID=UPI00298F04E4|nr:twin-arginine translocase TatA/TatE family subunit [Thermaurantiacus sp.]MCS6987669.1 twin-arginine translocase TatA/TatE family subunit [Sphingomonadaceae bacterium]MDW8415270.1 twin-arginine translocase TatA/TatE family subunit [Thermaurantiacus sp.]
MGSMSIWHWIIVGLVVLVLFGRGRIAELMGDVGKGIRAFRKGLADDEQAAHPVAQVTADPDPARTEGPGRS